MGRVPSVESLLELQLEQAQRWIKATYVEWCFAVGLGDLRYLRKADLHRILFGHKQRLVEQRDSERALLKAKREAEKQKREAEEHERRFVEQLAQQRQLQAAPATQNTSTTHNYGAPTTIEKNNSINDSSQFVMGGFEFAPSLSNAAVPAQRNASPLPHASGQPNATATSTQSALSAFDPAA